MGTKGVFAARIAGLQRKLRRLDSNYRRGELDIGRYFRLKTSFETELFALTEYLRLNVQSNLPGEIYDQYFHPDSERLRAMFLETMKRQMRVLSPVQQEVATFRPLLDDVIFQERIGSKGRQNLLDSRELFPLSWSDYCGLNWDLYEKYVLDKEIHVYCAFPFLTVLSMFLYLKELRGYQLTIHYHLTTMEGVRKLGQKMEPVDVFVGSDIQAAAVLNKPENYANGIPVMLLPPGELPTMIYPSKGLQATSGIYYAQDGTSAQADIFRRLEKGDLSLKRILIEAAEKIDYQKIFHLNPEEARIISWEPLGSVFIDYLEPNIKIIDRSRLDYILFFSADFVRRDSMGSYALAIGLCNAWFTLINDPNLAVDLLLSDEHVLAGFARLHQATRVTQRPLTN